MDNNQSWKERRRQSTRDGQEVVEGWAIVSGECVVSKWTRKGRKGGRQKMADGVELLMQNFVVNFHVPGTALYLLRTHKYVQLHSKARQSVFLFSILAGVTG